MYDNTNRGALFKNSRKEGVASNPDYNGEHDQSVGLFKTPAEAADALEGKR